MSSTLKVEQRRYFGPFSLNLLTRELRQGNARVRLQPQPARLLTLLTDRPGELITREEIRRLIWGDDVYLEFEPALNFAIGQIRSALNDSASRPLYIETVPKIGYRFIASVEEPDQLPAADSSSKEELISSGGDGTPADRSGPGESREDVGRESSASISALAVSGLATPGVGGWLLGAWITLGVVILGAAVLMGIPHMRRMRGGSQAGTSIVVLPFVNLTGDSAKEYLADGLTEEMIARLAMMSGGHLRVIARTSSMFYKMKAVTAKQVGAELGASYVLESSIRGEASGLQVTMQLVRAADESHVWTNVFSTDTDQVFASTGSLASEVLKALPLPELPSQATAVYVSASVPARDQYLRGQQFLWLRTRDSLYKALDSFQSAVAADPSYAQAYAELGTTYNLLGQYGWMEQREAAYAGEKAADRALSLNPTLADAHATRGFSRWFYQWDWMGAEQDFEDALRSDPSNANALHWYALALMTEGRFPEARSRMDRALMVDPKSQIIQTNRGWIEYFSGHPEEAVRRMELVLRDDPGFLSARNKLWSVYSFQNKSADAFRQVRFILPYSVTPEREEAILLAYRTSGYSAAMAEWLKSAPETDHGNAADVARVAMFANNREGAIKILLNGYRTHDGWMVFALTDPAFAPLRADPRIRGLSLRLQPSH